jgi:conjugal transfer pilus assembly protein TraV
MRCPASIQIGLLALAVSAATTGCTTFGTNVSGSFRCEAPDGICAPSTVIDDRALQEIVRGDRVGFASPAGLYKVDDGIAVGREAKDDGGPPASQTTPTEEFRLSVVFPAYTDVDGVVHARSLASVEAHLPGRTAVSVDLARRSRNGEGSPGLLAAAQGAPLLEDGTAGSPAPTVVFGEGGQNAKSLLDRIKADTAARTRQRAARHADPFPAQE